MKRVTNLIILLMDNNKKINSISGAIDHRLLYTFWGNIFSSLSYRQRICECYQSQGPQLYTHKDHNLFAKLLLRNAMHLQAYYFLHSSAPNNNKEDCL